MATVDLSLYGAITPDRLQDLNQLIISFTGSEAIPYQRHEVTVVDQNKRIKSILNEGNRLRLVEKGRPEISAIGNYRQVGYSEVKEEDIGTAMSNLNLEFWFETLLKGFQFRADLASILVYKVYDIEEQFNIESAKEFDSAIVVEVTAPQVMQEMIPQMSKILHEIRDHLLEVVEVKAVDHGCLQQKRVN